MKDERSSPVKKFNLTVESLKKMDSRFQELLAMYNSFKRKVEVGERRFNLSDCKTSLELLNQGLWKVHLIKRLNFFFYSREFVKLTDGGSTSFTHNEKSCVKPYISYRLTKNKSKLDLIISAWLESNKIVV